MDFLDPPTQFVHPQPGVAFDLPVVRWEVGLAIRPVLEHPFAIVRPTIRFHLSLPLPPSLVDMVESSGSADTTPVTLRDLELRPYLDFTNRLLTNTVLEIYKRLQDELFLNPLQKTVADVNALLPSRPEPVVLRLVRRGAGMDTVYTVVKV